MTEGRLVTTIRTPLASYAQVRLGLRGRHQLANAVVATRLLEELGADGRFAIPPDAIRTALEDVVWPGRLEWLRWQGHDVLLDGAHNPAGARALAAYVREVFARPLPCVIGAMGDKQVTDVITALAPVASSFVCTAANTRRAAAPDAIAAVARSVAPETPIEVVPSPMEAVAAAARVGGPVLVAGSLYLVGEIRAQLV
jgi:dihydrofolate synthase/folylpolyglutamate synthase